MSPREIHSYTALQPSEVQSILDWLIASGVQPSNNATIQYVAGSDAIVVKAQVAHIEAAFSTQLSTYSHAELGSSIGQSLTATSHMPDHVAPLVAMVRGLTNHPRNLTRSLIVNELGKEWKPANWKQSPHRAADTTSNDTDSHSFHTKQVEYIYSISPANVLAKWYGLPDRTSSTKLDSPKISIGVFAPPGGYFSPADLQIYSYLESATQNRSYMEVPPSHVYGGTNNAASPGGEESLDIQASTSINPQATPYYILDGSGGDWYIFTLWVRHTLIHLRPPTLSSTLVVEDER